MAVAYTPGLAVKHHTVLRKERKLPILGEVLVKKGDRVANDAIVARTDLPGAVRPVNIANLLRIPPTELANAMSVKEGDSVEQDQIVAETSSFFGLFKNNVKAPITGTVESISHVTGQVLFREPPNPVQVSAYVDGIIADVIPKEGVIVETRGGLIQGIFGVGGEAHGTLVTVVESPNEPLQVHHFKDEHRGKIIVGGNYVGAKALAAAKEKGVAGVVVGGFDDSDLKQLLKKDLGVAITGRENLGFTLVLTEGFGPIPMAQETFTLLQECQGRFASINGATQIRAGVIRPEIIVPDLEAKTSTTSASASAEMGMVEGSHVRIIRQPHFGTIGVVKSLPHELQAMDSEAKVRVVEVTLPDGSAHTLPRANVEIIAGDEGGAA